MKQIENIVIFLGLIFSTLLLAQKNDENTLEVEFAYLSKAKLDKTNSFVDEEVFLLQVLKDKAFFFSENMAKNDSARQSDIYRAFAATPKGRPINVTMSDRLKNKYDYSVLQTSQENHYFEGNGSSSYTYKEPVIKDWKLINESETINTFSCKKATLHYKGRDWVAWYAPEIPLPYGPYKFTGLPGLVVKIESEDGEFSFELVKSTFKDNLNGKALSLQDSRYKKATPATFSEIRKMKKSNIERLVAEAVSMGIDTSAENVRNLLERQKRKLHNFENENLIEKTEH
ncbi:GLPGLI family protein [Riemerella anatipestifer]|uniref:GLPGLI family protein n=1 Tax=Riemerella anatipestifer TaxID=34085 RepID=UPI002A8A6888|nr:GLPGLI family protein [Riemerella anatipestifer]